MNAQHEMEISEIGAPVVDFFQFAVQEETDLQIQHPDVSFAEAFGASVPAGFFEKIDSAVGTATGANSLASINRAGKQVLAYYDQLAVNLNDSHHPFAEPMDTLVRWLNGLETEAPDGIRLDGSFSRFLSLTLADGQRVVTAPLGDTVVLPMDDEWTIVVQPVGLGQAKANPRVSVDTTMDAKSVLWKPCEPSAFAIFRYGVPVAATPQSLQRATAEALFGQDPMTAIRMTIQEYRQTMVRLQEALGQEIYDKFHPMLEPMTFSWVLAPMIMRNK